MSKIEWTNKSWNPVVGCSKVSAGCKNCYAIRMAWRLQHIGHSKEKYAGTVEKTANGSLNWTGKVNTIESELVKPLKWKKPAMIFVNSQSDLFHESIPFEFIRKVFGVMSVCKEHTFQVLTKRPKRMVEFFKWFDETDPDMQNDPAHEAYDLCMAYDIETGCGSAFETDAWPLKNVWLGVSVEDQKSAAERIPSLLQAPAAIRFLSCEPLLGPVNLAHIDADAAGHKEYCQINALTGRHTDMARPCRDVEKIDWVIVGGESGNGARPMHPNWARAILYQCKAAGIAYFFKQWGQWKPLMKGDSRQPDYGTFKDNPGDWNDEPVGTFLPDVFGLGWGTLMTKVGKIAAGRQMDGREWNEFPVPGKRALLADDPDLYVGGFD